MFPTIHGVASQGAAGGGGDPGGDLEVIASSGVKSIFGFSVDVPTGTQDGDLMLAFVARRSNSTAPNLATQGWTLLQSDTAGDTRAWLYSKIASNEPASYAVASGGHTGAAMVTLRAGAIDATAIGSDGSLANIEAPTVTASTAPGILVCFWCKASGTVSTDVTPPGTMDPLEQEGDNNLRFAAAWEAFEASGALGVRTATGPVASGDRAGISVAVVGA